MIPFMMTMVGDNPYEQERFRMLYDKYHKLMYIRAFSYLNDENDALDTVQEASLRIADNFDKINDIGCDDTKHFILTIVDNQAKTALEHRNRVAKEDDALLEAWKIRQDELESSITDEYSEIAMLDLVDTLPLEYRRPLKRICGL